MKPVVDQNLANAIKKHANGSKAEGFEGVQQTSQMLFDLYEAIGAAEFVIVAELKDRKPDDDTATARVLKPLSDDSKTILELKARVVPGVDDDKNLLVFLRDADAVRYCGEKDEVVHLTSALAFQLFFFNAKVLKGIRFDPDGYDFFLSPNEFARISLHPESIEEQRKRIALMIDLQKKLN